jgi:hypothetical protein
MSKIACRFVGDATSEIAGSVYVDGESDHGLNAPCMRLPYMP